MAKLLSYLCWHGNKSKNKKNANSIILLFYGEKNAREKKIQFPNLLTKVKDLTHRWNISVAKDIKRRSNVLYGKQNCAVLWGYSYWINFSATRHHNLTKIKPQHSTLCWWYNTRDYNAKPIRDGNSKRWGWGKENLFIFGKIIQKSTLRMKFWQNASVNCLLLKCRT